MTSFRRILLASLVLLAWPRAGAVEPAARTELERLRHPTLAAREQTLAQVRELRTATAEGDDERRFLLDCVLVEVLAKSPVDHAIRRARRAEALRQLEQVRATHVLFARHPYRIFLELRLVPDTSAPDYPDAASLELATGLLRDHYLENLPEVFPPAIDHVIGMMIGTLMQDRHKRDLRPSKPPAVEFEVMSGMQALEELRTLPTPPWLLAARATGLKEFIRAKGQTERLSDTIRQLDAIIAGGRKQPPASTPAPVASVAPVPVVVAAAPPAPAPVLAPPSNRSWLIGYGALALVVALLAVGAVVRLRRARMKAS